MQADLSPQDFQTQVLTELRNINTRLNTLETKVDKLKTEVRDLRVESSAYQRGLDGMVRMAITIIITTGAVVILGNLSPALITLAQEVGRITPR